VSPLPRFLEAVAREEGFYVEGSRSNRNNNPGNIEYGKFAQAHGATSLETIPPGINEKPVFAFFPNIVSGFSAMQALFQAPVYSGLDVSQAITKWAPPSENNTTLYIQNVCTWAGCKPTDLVSSLLQPQT
jgi:hypothetical protein